ENSMGSFSSLDICTIAHLKGTKLRTSLTVGRGAEVVESCLFGACNPLYCCKVGNDLRSRPTFSACSCLFRNWSLLMTGFLVVSQGKFYIVQVNRNGC
ncbi:hypothetical protein GUITHDRAFT_153681, partial [Guillardia theta CCMP2712]